MTKDEDEYQTAYGFVRQVENELDQLDATDSQIALDVNMSREENTINLDYSIESLGWYEELGKESISYINSYSFTPEDDLVPNDEVMESIIEDNFMESALRVNGKVIRESHSPDYDAF